MAHEKVVKISFLDIQNQATGQDGSAGKLNIGSISTAGEYTDESEGKTELAHTPLVL